ncbi:MAG: hypothetical protein AAF938_20100, partial [Myxococcota bacterium]
MQMPGSQQNDGPGGHRSDALQEPLLQVPKLHAPKLTQPAPLVLREQPTDELLELDWQLPDPHVNVVVVRVSVPVLSQVLLKPPQAPSEVVVEPHVVPFVLREQPTVELLELAWQVPEPHVRVVVVRVSVPVLSHVVLKPPQAPSEVVVEPQVVPLVLREQPTVELLELVWQLP